MEIKKILWASDGSQESQDALKYVEALCDKYGAEVIALSVIPDFDFDKLHLTETLKKEFEDLMPGLVEAEEERLNDALKKLRQKGIRCEVRVETGVEDETILRVAKEADVELIAMGKRGQSLKDRLLLGSNTNKVIRASRIPVMAVRYHEELHEDFDKILVTTDLTELAVPAIKFAIALAAKFNSKLYFLNVVTYHHSYDVVSTTLVDTILEQTSEALEKQFDEIAGESQQELDVEKCVNMSMRTWAGVVDFAEENEVDLIIMATHGRTGVERFLLGSITEKVIIESPCPVICINPSH